MPVATGFKLHGQTASLRGAALARPRLQSAPLRMDTAGKTYGIRVCSEKEAVALELVLQQGTLDIAGAARIFAV